MIGIDILKIDRIADFAKRHSGKLTRVFTHSELQYYVDNGQKPQTLAGFFCAKESFLKALGVGLKGVKLVDICVGHNANGQPCLTLSDNASKLLANRQPHISISHTDDTAVAVCILI